MTTGKTISLTRGTFVGEVMTLFFNMLWRFVITFLPRSNHLLISWLQSSSAVILEPKKIKSSVTVSTVSPSICHEVMGSDAMILVFWILSFKPTFSLSSFTFIEFLQFFFTFCHKSGVICISEVIDISPGWTINHPTEQLTTLSFSAIFMFCELFKEIYRDGDKIGG